MNKLLVQNSRVSIKDDMVLLDIKTKVLSIKIRGSVYIEDTSNDTDLDLEIFLEPHSHLLYNRLNQDIHHFHVDIHSTEDSYVEFNYSLLTSKKSDIVFSSSQTGNRNVSHIHFCGVTKDSGQIISKATSSVSFETKDNVVEENLRILALNDAENSICPNLLVSSDSVSAYHNTVISSVDKEYLFYLNSKGISNKEATKLIVDGFLKGNLKRKER